MMKPEMECGEISDLAQQCTEGWIYHLSCDKCNSMWYSEDAFPKKCPFCGADR